MPDDATEVYAIQNNCINANNPLINEQVECELEYTKQFKHNTISNVVSSVYHLHYLQNLIYNIRILTFRHKI